MPLPIHVSRWLQSVPPRLIFEALLDVHEAEDLREALETEIVELDEELQPA